MRVSLWSSIIFVSTFYVTYGQQVNIQDECYDQETCTACIRNPNCAWCDIVVNEHITEPPAQCVTQQHAACKHLNHWCKQGNEENPHTNGSIVKNDTFSAERNRKFIQIQPQVVNLTLRRGQEYRLFVRYRQAEDYPVDLYFVADVSYSMDPFWKEFSQLRDQIVKAMKKLTTNFRLGFGSFIDKNIRPMVRDQAKWDGLYHYSFRHHMPLTANYEAFETEVKKAEINGNSDNPEGGLDGVMQAMVCKKEIGWRSDARHILVYASDDAPHIAGDGRLAGLPQPNDMECHLNSTGYYSHAELQDFPSLGQIKYQANENNINIIFVVNKAFKKVYDEIQSIIPGSSVGILDQNSENIVQLISTYYKELVKSLTMTSNSTSDFLSIKYFSKCLNQMEKSTEKNRCDGIRVNDTVEFEVVIKAIDCPEREEEWKQIIEIKPEGINEGVIVNLELICSCECSKKSIKTATAPRARECHYHGVLDCGVCSCDRGYFGQWCQCEGDQASATTDALEASCRSDNSTKICSDRGSCKCGSCDCHKRKYYGKFCQCDNFSCRPSKNGQLCEGRGRCECGKCVCNSGWGGEACECRDDTSLCLPPGENAKICSGAGKCVCGQCICDKEMKRNGRFCEDCSSCPSQRCDEFKDCVECRVHRSGKIYEGDHDCLQCPDNIQKVDELDQDKINSEEHTCRIAGDDGSTFVFIYVYDAGKDNKVLTIFAKKDKEFRPINDLVVVTLGVVLLTLFLGLLILLIWKVSTHIHDKREFEKFDKERRQAKWGQGQNPLYKTAVTTFQNPSFDAALKDEDL